MQAPSDYTVPPLQQTPSVQSTQPASQTPQVASQRTFGGESSRIFTVLLIVSISSAGIGIFFNELPDVQGAPSIYDYDSDFDNGVDEYNEAYAEFSEYKKSMQSVSNIITGIAGIMIIFALFLEGVGNNSMPNGVRIVMTAGACLILYNGLPLSIF
jgi:hypothetical protein